jgi:hypothetical protein
MTWRCSTSLLREAVAFTRRSSHKRQVEQDPTYDAQFRGEAVTPAYRQCETEIVRISKVLGTAEPTYGARSTFATVKLRDYGSSGG